MGRNVRHYWIDLLNVIACFAVVVLHCSTSIFMNTGNAEWLIDVVYQSLCIFAVPVFFMISGANLLGYRKKYDTKTFFVKRFKKVVFTLCVASAIVYVSSPLIKYAVAGYPVDISMWGFIDGLFHNTICDVYWFFYAILMLYLVTPIFSLIVDNKRLLQYAIIICIISTMIIPLLNRFMPTDDFFSLLAAPYLKGWITYYLLGYYLQHHLSKQISIPAVLLMTIASCGIIIAMTYKTNLGHTVLSGSYQPYDSFYANASSLFALLYSTGVFLLFKSCNNKIGNLRSYGAIRSLSSFSLGVYAIHMLVINSLDLFIPHRILWDLGLRPFIVFAISLLLAWIGVKIMAWIRTCVSFIFRQSK